MNLTTRYFFTTSYMFGDIFYTINITLPNQLILYIFIYDTP